MVNIIFNQAKKTAQVSLSTTPTICENMTPGLQLLVLEWIAGTLFLLNRRTGFLLDTACTSAQRLVWKKDRHVCESVLVLEGKQTTNRSNVSGTDAVEGRANYGSYAYLHRRFILEKNIFKSISMGLMSPATSWALRVTAAKKKSSQETRKQLSSSTRNRNRKMKELNIGQLLNGVYPVFLTKPHSTPFSACIAERFHVNAIFREQFHESIWHRLEKHFSSLNNALKRYLVVRRFPKPRSKFNFV